MARLSQETLDSQERMRRAELERSTQKGATMSPAEQSYRQLNQQLQVRWARAPGLPRCTKPVDRAPPMIARRPRPHARDDRRPGRTKPAEPDPRGAQRSLAGENAAPGAGRRQGPSERGARRFPRAAESAVRGSQPVGASTRRRLWPRRNAARRRLSLTWRFRLWRRQRRNRKPAPRRPGRRHPWALISAPRSTATLAARPPSRRRPRRLPRSCTWTRRSACGARPGPPRRSGRASRPHQEA